MRALTEQELGAIVANPGWVLRQLDKLDAEDSLLDYTRLMWHVLEPGRRFVEGWAVEATCDVLTAVTEGEVKKVLINVPPGCMKSLTTNVLWPSWEWGPRNMPSTRYVSASYSQDLTVRDNRRCRNLIVSQIYQAFWGDRYALVSDQNAKVRYDTDKTGFKIATSVGGLGTGERGDRFIIDDAHNVKDGESEAKREEALHWFSEVVPTRINDAEKSARVIIMQRVHERDVSGLVIANELGYEHLMLPMEYEPKYRCFLSIPPKHRHAQAENVHRVKVESDPIPRYIRAGDPELESPELSAAKVSPARMMYCWDARTEEGELLWADRFSRTYLEDDLKPSLRAWGGTYAEAGQLQQRPAPRGGGMFQKKDFQYVDRAPQGGRRVRGWDLASSKETRAAYTVGLKMAMVSGNIYIEDVHRGRWTPGNVETELKGAADRDGKAVPISLPQDPGQAGKSQVSAFAKLLHGWVVHASPETGSKEDRAKPLAAQCEAGNLYLVRGPWNDAFINEATVFPNGEFLDQVDAASRAYSYLLRTPESLVGVGPMIIEG